MDVRIEETWHHALCKEFDKDYFAQLVAFIRQEYTTKTIYPPAKEIFSAFDSCPFDQVKVVIIGQDPYHEPLQAHGLCFSVREKVDIPPSLQNIYKELESDLGIIPSRSGCLHQGKGWETFTDAAIQKLAQEREGLVFILWGSYAQKKGAMIDPTRHLILRSAHPSPLSAYRGFFGSKPFSQTNAYLMQLGKTPISW